MNPELIQYALLTMLVLAAFLSGYLIGYSRALSRYLDAHRAPPLNLDFLRSNKRTPALSPGNQESRVTPVGCRSEPHRGEGQAG